MSNCTNFAQPDVEWRPIPFSLLRSNLVDQMNWVISAEGNKRRVITIFTYLNKDSFRAAPRRNVTDGTAIFDLNIHVDGITDPPSHSIGATNLRGLNKEQLTSLFERCSCTSIKIKHKTLRAPNGQVILTRTAYDPKDKKLKYPRCDSI